MIRDGQITSSLRTSCCSTTAFTATGILSSFQKRKQAHVNRIGVKAHKTLSIKKTGAPREKTWTRALFFLPAQLTTPVTDAEARVQPLVCRNATDATQNYLAVEVSELELVCEAAMATWAIWISARGSPSILPSPTMCLLRWVQTCRYSKRPPQQELSQR